MKYSPTRGYCYPKDEEGFFGFTWLTQDEFDRHFWGFLFLTILATCALCFALYKRYNEK